MNRRHFLRLASMAVVGLAIDPEELVWTPRVMITVPAMPQPELYLFNGTPFIWDKAWPTNQIYIMGSRAFEQYQHLLKPSDQQYLHDVIGDDRYPLQRD